MKSQDLKGLRAKRGVRRLWLGVAAVTGAAIAFLGDPERGNARRQEALRRLSGAAQAAAGRTSRWRNIVSARLPGRSHGRPPAQITVPNEPGSAETKKPKTTGPGLDDKRAVGRQEN